MNPPSRPERTRPERKRIVRRSSSTLLVVTHRNSAEEDPAEEDPQRILPRRILQLAATDDDRYWELNMLEPLGIVDGDLRAGDLVELSVRVVVGTPPRPTGFPVFPPSGRKPSKKRRAADGSRAAKEAPEGTS